MFALSVLYFVLPFLLVFAVHEGEELATQYHWLQRNAEKLKARMPRAEKMIDRLTRLGHRGFCVAVAEELIILLAVTAYVLVDGPYALQVWAAVFLAFGLHLLVHLVQAIVVRGYVPGLLSAILFLPYFGYVARELYLAMGGVTTCVCGIVGLLFVYANLGFAHWLGQTLARGK